MGRQQASAVQSGSRPKRRATNAHVFRYLQTRNPSKLEENDLKRALEASLEECPDFWPAEDSASCSSSEQSLPLNGLASSSSSSNSTTSSRSCSSTSILAHHRLANQTKTKRRPKSSSMQLNHLNCNPNHLHPSHSFTTSHNCCPLSSVHNRYKPVAKKNIYNEADFFHDGIMQYIEYQLTKTRNQGPKTR